MILQRLCFSLLLILFGTYATHAVNLQSSPLYEIPLAIPGTQAGKTLGTKLAVSRATAAIAVLTDDKTSTGAVYLYDALENWRLIAELNSLSSSDNFG